MKTPLAAYHETKQHGSALFPFDIYPCTIPLSFPGVPLHWHTSMEIIYIKKGEGQVQVGMEWYAATAGDIFVVLPEVFHAIRGSGEHIVKMEYENIIFALDFLGLSSGDLCAQKYLSLLLNGKVSFPVRYRPGEESYEALARSLAEAEKLCEFCPRGYELAVKSSIFRFIFQLFQTPDVLEEDVVANAFATTKATQRLKTVLEIIQAEYMNDLKISTIASRVGYSSSHFMRWFKEMTGESFVHYLNERRLVVAADLLRKSDDYVVDIAGQVGFTNLTNFNRQFKLRFGLSPRAYRRGE